MNAFCTTKTYNLQLEATTTPVNPGNSSCGRSSPITYICVGDSPPFTLSHMGDFYIKANLLMLKLNYLVFFTDNIVMLISDLSQTLHFYVGDLQLFIDVVRVSPKCGRFNRYNNNIVFFLPDLAKLALDFFFGSNPFTCVAAETTFHTPSSPTGTPKCSCVDSKYTCNDAAKNQKAPWITTNTTDRLFDLEGHDITDYLLMTRSEFIEKR